jgi:hypothetical protein
MSTSTEESTIELDPVVTAEVEQESNIAVPPVPPVRQAETQYSDPATLIREKILMLLQIYPRVSPTMLQAGLGPSLSPEIWRPVFNEMLADGTLIQFMEAPENTALRVRPFTVIQLAGSTPTPTQVSGSRADTLRVMPQHSADGRHLAPPDGSAPSVGKDHNGE